jgi:hypothetical protein
MKSTYLIVITGTLFVLTYIFYMLGFFSFSSSWFPKSEIIHNHNIVLEKIEQLGKLELVKYKFKDIYDYTEKGYIADETVGIIISAEAVGCVDLKRIKKENIQTKGDTLTIEMPQPELCYWKINQNETRIYNSFHIRMNSADLYGKAYKEAEKFILQVALKSDIMERTKDNAEKILKPLLEKTSQKKVILKYTNHKKYTKN